MSFDWIYLLAVPLICVSIFIMLYPMFYPEPQADRIHKAQQEALKRHAKAIQKDRERIDAYWRERGKTIKPMDKTRYGAWVDENETPT